MSSHPPRTFQKTLSALLGGHTLILASFELHRDLWLRLVFLDITGRQDGAWEVAVDGDAIEIEFRSQSLC